MEAEEKSPKRNYEKMGCLIGLLVLILIIILIWTGVINYNWEF